MIQIGKLPNVNSLTVSQEPQPETTSQAPAVQPATSTGIASTNDGFETASPMTSDLFGLVGEQTEILVSNQTVIPPDPTVDASMLFDYVADVQEPVPPVPAEDWTQSLYTSKTSAESAPDPTEGLGIGNVLTEMRRPNTENVKPYGNARLTDSKYLEANGKAIGLRPSPLEQLRTEIQKDYKTIEESQKSTEELWDLGMSDGFDLARSTTRDTGLGEAAPWFIETAGNALEFAGDAGEWTVEAAEDIAEAAAKAAEEAQKAAHAAIKAAEDAAEDVIDEVGEVLEDAVDAAGDVASDVGDALEEFFGDFW